MLQNISEYIKTKDFASVDKIKRMLISLYKDNIRKHAKRLSLKVEKYMILFLHNFKKHDKKCNLNELES